MPGAERSLGGLYGTQRQRGYNPQNTNMRVSSTPADISVPRLYHYHNLPDFPFRP